jgi:dTDP-4-dehydrorhamnose 3,5-epimerase
MRFRPFEIEGAHQVELEPHPDERGFFARTWCREEFARHGIEELPAQCSISWNARAGTLRGMHYQADPHPETKLVRCIRGAIYDVLADVRPGSATYGRWSGVVLDAKARNALYVPACVAHGFLTLEPDTEVLYQISALHQPDAGRGIRWDDPAFAIRWPRAVEVISERDRRYPDFLGLT